MSEVTNEMREEKMRAYGEDKEPIKICEKCGRDVEDGETYWLDDMEVCEDCYDHEVEEIS